MKSIKAQSIIRMWVIRYVNYMEGLSKKAFREDVFEFSISSSWLLKMYLHIGVVPRQTTTTTTTTTTTKMNHTNSVASKVVKNFQKL